MSLNGKYFAGLFLNINNQKDIINFSLFVPNKRTSDYLFFTLLLSCVVKKIIILVLIEQVTFHHDRSIKTKKFITKFWLIFNDVHCVGLHKDSRIVEDGSKPAVVTFFFEYPTVIVMTVTKQIILRIKIVEQKPSNDFFF